MTASPAKSRGAGHIWWFIAAVAFLLTVAAIIGVWRYTRWIHELDINPVVSIPPYPPAPVPNAYDSYLAASALLKYQGPVLGIIDDSSKYPTVSSADREAFVANNAPAIEILRSGFGKDYQEPEMRDILDTSSKARAPIPPYEKYSKLGRLLRFAAWQRAQEGDYNGALRFALDGVEFGQAPQHGTSLISFLIAMVNQKRARDAAWEVVPHLDGSTARAGAHRLETILAGHPSDLPSVLTEIKYSDQALLMNTFALPRNQWLLTPGMAKYRFLDKRKVMAEHTAYIDALIARARLPFSHRGPLPTPPTDVFAGMYFSKPYDTSFAADVCLCENRLLLVALAVTAYRAEHNAAPATLTDLVPKYLRAVPDDPFGTGPLRYKPSGADYVLYSIGPDGVDDGGKPCYDQTISAESKGDLVAGALR